MNSLIRLYNQNRRMFWGIVFSVALIGMILWRFIYLIFPTRENIVYTEQPQVNTSTLNTVELTNEKSAITGNRTSINQDIIETLDKVIEIHQNGRVKRQEAEKQLEQIEGELKDKLLEIKMDNN